MDVVDVLVHGANEVSRAGAAAMLSSSSRLRLLTEDEMGTGRSGVVVLVVDGIAEAKSFAYLQNLRARCGRSGGPKCVLVTHQFRAEAVLPAVESGIEAVLYRAEITEGALVSAVLAVSRGAAVLPPHLQGVLLAQLSQLRSQVLEPAGLTLSGLETRECEVLRLIAEGLQTDEIAERLTYSEGTVKNVLYGLMSRLGLQSRAHAVAYAMRAGVI
ncbi:response regulator transcription factor [Lentzea sp. NBRC 102530]|uniref:response regulator transcription factor n=1 Tax=Lentzea sp. NBRC 102530 TaxID=3032201 RepID=UPI00249FDE70|nr:response regulator transcription factor [Lentzea sp. NBRC 102530]GLY46825.1 hypothetical protein Lesp01_04810 [Lentzea sp. NBRC 102530]